MESAEEVKIGRKMKKDFKGSEMMTMIMGENILQYIRNEQVGNE